MNKLMKYALLVGVAVSMTASGEALGASGLAGIANALAGDGEYVVDLTSGPAHDAVIAMQLLSKAKTRETIKIKNKIRPRVSVIYEKNKNGSDGAEDGDSEGEESEDEEGGEENKRKIDAKLSKIEIPCTSVTDLAGEGIAGKGVDDIISKQRKISSQQLVDDQQKKYISAAGTQETQELYERQRQYNEQEQAIQMIAYAATVRQNVNDTITEMVSAANANYDGSDVPKDLDPESDKERVEKSNDYNQTVRQYAYYSLIYDQLLSLEQQILGLRLQAKGALSEQRASVLDDVVEK